MSPTEAVCIKLGVIQEVDIDNHSVQIQASGEMPVTAFLPFDSGFMEVPRVKDIWEFYFTGNAYRLQKRFHTSSNIDAVVLHEGDVEISVPFNLFIRAASLDIQDEHGYFFDPVTGKINPARLPDTHVDDHQDDDSGKGKPDA